MAQRLRHLQRSLRKKSRIREEGYRRPQDALLSVQGVRLEENAHEPEHKVYGVGHAATGAAAAAAAAAPAPEPEQPFTVQCSDVRAERDQVEKLYKALSEAKKKSGEAVSGNLDSFTSFVQKKTNQIKKQYAAKTWNTPSKCKRPRKAEGQSEDIVVSH